MAFSSNSINQPSPPDHPLNLNSRQSSRTSSTRREQQEDRDHVAGHGDEGISDRASRASSSGRVSRSSTSSRRESLRSSCRITGACTCENSLSCTHTHRQRTFARSESSEIPVAEMVNTSSHTTRDERHLQRNEHLRSSNADIFATPLSRPPLPGSRSVNLKAVNQSQRDRSTSRSRNVNSSRRLMSASQSRTVQASADGWTTPVGSRYGQNRTVTTGGDRTPVASGYGYGFNRTAFAGSESHTIMASENRSVISGVDRYRHPAVPDHTCNPPSSKTSGRDRDQESAYARQRRNGATAAVWCGNGGGGGGGGSYSKCSSWWLLLLLIPLMVGVYQLRNYYASDENLGYEEVSETIPPVVNSPRSPGGSSPSCPGGPVPFTDPSCSSDPIETVHNCPSTPSSPSFQPCPGCPTNEPPSCTSCPSYDDTEMVRTDDYLKQKVVTLEKQLKQMSDHLVQLEIESRKVRGEMEKSKEFVDVKKTAASQSGAESSQEVHLIVDKYLEKRISGIEVKLADLHGDVIDAAISKYDADKTGRPDLALESGGGSVVSTRCTKKSDFVGSTISFWGVPIYYPSNSPRKVIQPGVMPGDCWSFDGAEGYIVLKLVGPTQVTGFTVEHLPKSISPLGHIDSAPRKFTVVGLTNYEDPSTEFVFGEYQYEDNNVPIQYFAVQNKSDTFFPFVELKILSNHGNLEYTCLYRFRVHGYLESWVGLLKS